MSVGTRHVVSLSAILGVLLGAPVAQCQPAVAPPIRLSLPRPPEPQAPRIALHQPVSLDLEGTVVEIADRLLRPLGLEYLVGVYPPDAHGPASFTVEDASLSEALDLLLETHGYDWGVESGVVVLWPATQPSRERARPGEADDAPGPLPEGAQSLDLPTPQPVAEFLDMAQEVGFLTEMRYLPVRETRAWLVAGRIGPGPWNRLIMCLAHAVQATTDGMMPVGILKPNSTWRLDRALRWLREHQSAIPAEDRFRTGVSELLSAQQWVLLRAGGIVEIPFCDLPTETAAVFVAAAEEMATRVRRMDVC